MQIEIKGWIFAKPDAYTGKITFEFSEFDYEDAVKRGTGAASWGAYKKVTPHAFVVDVPEDIDPRELLIAGLEAERTKVRAELTRRITEINDQISKLQAISYEPVQS